MKHHLKHMAIAGGAILILLLVLGVELGRALPYALLLACPIGMVAMMGMMQRRAGHGGAAQHDAKLPASDPAAPRPGQEITRENHERLPRPDTRETNVPPCPRQGSTPCVTACPCRCFIESQQSRGPTVDAER